MLRSLCIPVDLLRIVEALHTGLTTTIGARPCHSTLLGASAACVRSTHTFHRGHGDVCLACARRHSCAKFCGCLPNGQRRPDFDGTTAFLSRQAVSARLTLQSRSATREQCCEESRAQYVITDAPLHQWTSVATKADKRIEDILFPSSMAARILLHTSHVVSLTADKSQLAPLPREVRQSAAKALQRTQSRLRGRRCQPSSCATPSFPASPPRRRTSVFARARAASLRAVLRSGVLTVVAQRIGEFQNSDAAALDPRRAWPQSSTFSYLAEVRLQAHALPVELRAELDAGHTKRVVRDVAGNAGGDVGGGGGSAQEASHTMEGGPRWYGDSGV